MNKKIKILAITTSLLMLGAVFTGCTKKSSGGSKGDIKIGAVIPLSGDVATFGQSSKYALQLFEKQTNKSGGVLGKKIHFVYEDDENKPANSSNLTQKLIDDGVVGIIGSVASKCSIAMGPIATSNKIPMVTGDSTNPKVTTDGGEYVFRACFIDPFQGTVLAKFSDQKLSAKKAAVLYDVANDYSIGLAQYFQQQFTSQGGTVVSKQTYSTGATDFNAQLTKIKAANPDVILLPDYYNTVGLIAKQARNLGIKATFLGGDGWDSKDLQKVGGDAVVGSYFSNHYSPQDTSPAVTKFKEDYTAEYGKDNIPDALAVLTYDAATILVDGIKKAKSTDGTKIKDAIKTSKFSLISGDIAFDKDRNPIKKAVIIQVGKQPADNKFVETVEPDK